MDVRIKQEAPDADAPTMTSSSDVTTQQQHLLNINSLLMSITSSPLLGLPTSLASTHTYLQQFIANSAQSGIPPSVVSGALRLPHGEVERQVGRGERGDVTGRDAALHRVGDELL